MNSLLDSHFDSALAQDLERLAHTGSAATGQQLFARGAPCRHFPLLLEGRVRVQILSPQGREIVLYRLEPGQICLITACCLLGGVAHAAQAIAETPIRFAVLDAGDFHRLLAQSEPFRTLVFNALGSRLAELMGRVQEVALERIDVRLARFLLNASPHAPDGVLRLTHQRIAVELGSAREVVSRQLKQFEHQGWIALARGSIALRDREALQRLMMD